MAEKKVLTEDEAQEMLERYYQRPSLQEGPEDACWGE